MAKSKGALLKSVHSLKERLISGVLAAATIFSIGTPLAYGDLVNPSPDYESGYPPTIYLQNFKSSFSYSSSLLSNTVYVYRPYFKCDNGGVYTGFCAEAGKSLNPTGTFVYHDTYNRSDFLVLTSTLDYYYAAEYSQIELNNLGLTEEQLQTQYGWGTEGGDARRAAGKFPYLLDSDLTAFRTQVQVAVWWALREIGDSSTPTPEAQLDNGGAIQREGSSYSWDDLYLMNDGYWDPSDEANAVIEAIAADRRAAEGYVTELDSLISGVKQMFYYGYICKILSNHSSAMSYPYDWLNTEYHIYRPTTYPNDQCQIIGYPKETNVEPGEWYGAITVNKISLDGRDVAGTKFSVYADQDCLYPAFSDFSFEVNSSGYGILEIPHDSDEDTQPPNDVFYVKEVEAAEGHVADHTGYRVEVTYYSTQAAANQNAAQVAGQAVSNDVVIDYPDSSLRKIDSKTLAGVGPATFTFTGYPYVDIYLPEDAPTPNQSITSGLYEHESDLLEDGEVSIPFVINDLGEGVIQWHSPDEDGYIRPGKYTVTETQAPQGYALSTESFDVDLYAYLAVGTNGATYVEFGGPEYFEIANDPLHRIKIKKVDEAGKSLSGAVFNLEKDGVVVDTQTTGDDGIIVFDGDGEGLASGFYEVIEVKAPDGYSMGSNSSQKILVDTSNHDQTVYEYTFTNYDKPEIRILKVDEAGQGIGGALFQVTLGDHDLGTHLSASNGEILFLASDYAEAVMTGDGPWLLTVTEVSPPPGYTLNPDISERTKQAWISKGQDSVSLIFENQPIPELEIYKLSGKNEPLGGAVYDVTVGEHTVSGVTSDEDGLFKIDYEEFGTYLDPELDSWTVTVTEVSAPPGYLLPAIEDRTQIKVLKAGQKKLTFFFVNEKYPEIEIYKTDDEGNPLGGGVYDVTIGNHSISGVVTGDDGKFLICWDTHGAFLDSTQEYWTVTVTEVSPPPGYTLPPVDERTKTEVLYAGQDLLQIHFRNQKIPEIEIYKTDNEGNPLAGAVYDVTIGTHSIPGVVTDEDGKFLICWETHGDFLDITQEYWTVTVTEVTAPPGYLLPAVDERTQTKVLYAGQDIMTFHFRNEKIPDIEILKTSADTGMPLAGAFFDVFIDEIPIGSWQTNTDGIITITYEEFGQYLDVSDEEWIVRIVETKAPAGYLLPEDTEHSKRLDLGMTKLQFEVWNSQYPMIEINKYETGTLLGLSGAVFSVKIDTSSLGTWETDENGKIFITYDEYKNFLTDGKASWTVTVEEMLPPAGYINDNAGQPVSHELLHGQSLQTFVFWNTRYPDITIKKVDREDPTIALEGATFKFMIDGTEIPGPWVTDHNGEAIISWDTIGRYLNEDNISHWTMTATELTAPTNYNKDAQPSTGDYTMTAQLQNGMSSVEFLFSDTSYRSIEVTKKDSGSGALLAGAEFTLTAISLDDGIASAWGSRVLTTDATGKVLFENVPNGTYQITETNAPSGYELNTMVVTVVVTSESPKVIEVDFTNDPYTSLYLLKLDKTDNTPVAGAKFKVETDTNSLVGTFETDLQGEILISGIMAGTYIVTEIAPPEGYEMDTVPQTVVVENGKRAYVEFYNEKQGSLILYLNDVVTNEPLQGGEFELRRAEDDVIVTIKTTDVAGSIVFGYLKAGKYIITQNYAPENYWIPDGDSIQEVIIIPGEQHTLNFYNETASMTIEKVDSVSLNVLEGARFKVTRNEDNLVIGEYETGRDGLALLSGLKPGMYTVEEIIAPDGYTLDIRV